MDYAISSKMNTFFRWVNDYQKEQNQNGIWTGEPFPIQPQKRPKPGSSWSWNLVEYVHADAGGRDHPVLQSPVAVAVDRGDNPLDRDKLGANFTQLYPQANLTNSIPDVQRVSHQLGPRQSGMAQRRQGLRLHRERLVCEVSAHIQIRLLLQSRRQEADGHLADECRTSISTPPPPCRWTRVAGWPT